MHYSVLIIDDEKELSEYTAKYFNMSGVPAQYALDSASALEFFKDNTCSLILLDINIPIFFISARSAEDDMLLALSIGGDDYICKPYSLSVLLAKVKAELKRYESTHKDDWAEEDTNTVQFGSAVFDMKKASVIKDGKVMPLKAMEYKILVYLIRNSDRVIPKEEIFEKIWDTTVVGDVTLNVHIRHLREKIEDDAGDPRFIKTVWGVGFMLDTKGNP